MRGSARELVDMATLHREGEYLLHSPLRPLRIPSASPPHSVAPGAPTVSPASMVSRGHSWAGKWVTAGG